MRFLILSQYFPPEIGAAQTRLAALACELQRNGHEVEVVTTMPSYWSNSTQQAYKRKFYMQEMWSGMLLHRCWSYAASGTGARRLLNYFSFTFSCLFGLLKARHADYIFVESPPLFLCIPAWLVSRLRTNGKGVRSEVIFNVADLWPDSVRDLGVLRDGPVLRMAHALERWAYQKARYVTVVTEGLRDALLRKGVPQEKLLFLPNGVDITTFIPKPPDSDLVEELQLEGKQVLLFAGTHGIVHDLATLIETARLMRDEPFVFLFVGAGTRKADAMALAAGYGLANVRFVDAQPLSEMPRYFSVALASAVALVKLELSKSVRPARIFPSLASGVPIIYCGEGETADLLVSTDTGIVLEPESPVLLANAIRSLAHDREGHARMARNARSLAVTRFSWPSIIQSWLRSLHNPRSKGRVAISGLPFFVDEIFGKTQESATEWDERILRFGNLIERVIALVVLARSSVWYTIGSIGDSRISELLASILRKPRVVHWVGSDIVKARACPERVAHLRKPHILHIAETEWTARELRTMGFDPQIASLPPTRFASTVPEFPDTFTVLLYVPTVRADFYGARTYERLIEDFSDRPVKFLIVGGGTLKLPAWLSSNRSRVENLGWCSDLETVYPRATTLLRMTERDGLSLMVLEALSFGRHVLWPQDFPFVAPVDGYSSVKVSLDRLLEQHRERKLRPQYAAATYINETYDRSGSLHRIAECWAASVRQHHKGCAHASLPV